MSTAKDLRGQGFRVHGWKVFALSNASADLLVYEILAALITVKDSSLQRGVEGTRLSASPIGVLGGVLKGL